MGESLKKMKSPTFIFFSCVLVVSVIVAILSPTLVTAAYPEYHFTRGAPGFLFLALTILIFGWCSFRYQKFQDFLFFLSLRSFWVNDPEPSDFYYFTSKVSGIIVMIGSLWIAFKAF